MGRALQSVVPVSFPDGPVRAGAGTEITATIDIFQCTASGTGNRPASTGTRSEYLIFGFTRWDLDS